MIFWHISHLWYCPLEIMLLLRNSCPFIGKKLFSFNQYVNFICPASWLWHNTSFSFIDVPLNKVYATFTNNNSEFVKLFSLSAICHVPHSESRAWLCRSVVYAMNVKNTVFWETMPCNLVDTCKNFIVSSFHRQDMRWRKWVPPKRINLTTKL